MNKNTPAEGGNKGIISQVIGPVVDVRFEGKMPKILPRWKQKLSRKTVKLPVWFWKSNSNWPAIL